MVALVQLRTGVSHAALTELRKVDCSTAFGAIREIRPLLAARGFAIPDRPRLRLRTLEDLFADADAARVDLCIDGTEEQVRRSRTGRSGRKAFVLGKKKRDTIRATTFSDTKGRTLFSGVVRPGRIRDQAAVHTEGIAEQFRQHPRVKAEVDEGYRAWPTSFPRESVPRPGSRRSMRRWADSTPGASCAVASPPGGSAWSTPTWRASSGNPCSGSPAAARPMPNYAETHLAVASLVSDRSARRATRRKASTELVPVR
ncbi:transposase family protein [Streptomyces sp. NPDC007100]|uniref:transposase family protein n=1 Tax=Streptomyces sp. NPDC007100 TaxID=3155602 RepID=UPI0033F94335